MNSLFYRILLKICFQHARERTFSAILHKNLLSTTL
jgi:hypothetical protein